MNVIRSATHLSKRGPAEYFTGTAWLTDIAAPAAATRVRMLRVSFEPGARTAWHTHPHGQTLHIVSGVARIQRAGEASVDVFPGDTVWFEPGERHWHGAAPHCQMTHLAIQLADESGATATWLEQVTDADYLGAK